eukprot:gnl/TRDRNA2_/TRDRNA2_187342_c0_seq1.p1 gnl/TRDRNA2_/TRDRNA2_187342_c0~~gnl/TRDRNA2_/TRDRNA2_187342_c0_seq1.p1  ORF type:complete len:500 (-),score=50.66 gnl/TRDRNA2_/TRDRNA2_187342_c0_seq1:101-1600(-)
MPAEHGVYVGGLSGGDTPPRSIPTIGAGGGRPGGNSEQAKRVTGEGQPYPYARDADAPFVQRNEGMWMDTVRAGDVPMPQKTFLKNYDRSLMTDDLPRARPTLAHPAVGRTMPVPWNQLNIPPKPDIPKVRAQTHYPLPQPNRPRDLSLVADDIEDAQPRRCGMNSEGRAREDCRVDPVNPAYALPSSENFSEFMPSVRTTALRDTMDISDIEFTKPAPAVPIRKTYTDPLRLENEFRAKRRDIAAMEVSARLAAAEAAPSGTPRAPSDIYPPFTVRSHTSTCTPRGAALENRKEGPQLSLRTTDPLDPDYQIPLPRDAPGTSLHATWEGDKKNKFDRGPPTSVHIVGRVPGSTPTTRIRDNGQPQFGLMTHDIDGAEPCTKIGSLPHSCWGPTGKRQPSQSLNTADITGAQANTHTRGPRKHSAAERETLEKNVQKHMVTAAKFQEMQDDLKSSRLAGKTYREFMEATEVKEVPYLVGTTKYEQFATTLRPADLLSTA